MPIALLVLGLLIIVTAYRGNYPAVAAQVEKDLTGAGGFFLWAFAIIFLAIAGNILQMPRATKLLIALIVVVYLVSNAGVFTQFEQAFNSTTPAPASAAVAATPSTGAPSAVGAITSAVTAAAGGSPTATTSGLSSTSGSPSTVLGGAASGAATAGAPYTSAIFSGLGSLLKGFGL